MSGTRVKLSDEYDASFEGGWLRIWAKGSHETIPWLCLPGDVVVKMIQLVQQPEAITPEMRAKHCLSKYVDGVCRKTVCVPCGKMGKPSWRTAKP